MTEAERAMLQKTHDIAMELHQAFMEPTATGEPPLIKRMAGVVIVVERSNWAAKMLVYGFLTVGSIAGAWAAIKGGFLK